MYIHKYIRELISEYREVYKKFPRGFNYDEWNSLEQYGEYLKSEINKETLRKRIKSSIVNNKNILLDNKNIYSIDEQIDFYKENIDILQSLQDKLKDIINQHEYTGLNTELSIVQKECIRKIIEVYSLENEDKFYIKLSEAFYQLINFIYYPNCEEDKISLYEIEIIKMLSNYLTDKAYEQVYILKGDKHKGKFKLQKTYSSISKEHFNLIYKDKIIGKGWIRKKLSYIRKGMYLYIDPDYRKQGYGTIFYNLLAIEMTKKDIDFIILKVNKYDNVAINFLDKQINQYEKRYNFFNKRIFIDTLIVN